SKYVFLLPIVIFAAGAFTVSKADGKISEVVTLAKETELKEIQLMLKPVDTLSIVADTLSLVGEVTFEAIEDKSSKTNGFVLDGELVDQKAIEQLNPKDVESVVVNIENALSEKLGLKSVLNIKTK